MVQELGKIGSVTPCCPATAPFFCAGAVPYNKTFVHAKFEVNPSTWAASRTVDVSRFRVGRRAATAGGGRAVAARPPPLAGGDRRRRPCRRRTAAASEGRPPPAQLLCAAQLWYHRFLFRGSRMKGIKKIQNEYIYNNDCGLSRPLDSPFVRFIHHKNQDRHRPAEPRISARSSM